MSEKLLRKSAAILLFVGFLCAPAHAQDPTGTLEGQIADPSTAAVSGAEIAEGLRLTGHFLMERMLRPNSREMPAARMRLDEMAHESK